MNASQLDAVRMGFKQVKTKVYANKEFTAHQKLQMGQIIDETYFVLLSAWKRSRETVQAPSTPREYLQGRM
jgi:hypothetical protein